MAVDSNIPSNGWLNIEIYFEKCGEPVNTGCAIDINNRRKWR